MTDAMLVFDGVTRAFGRRTAVEGLDLEIRPGEVVGLVGRNGAGKTTTLRLAAGLLWPDAGSIRTLGLDPVREGDAVRERVALMAEEASLFPTLTVGDTLRLVAGVHPRWDGTRAERFRDRMDLDPGARVDTLSRGGRAKLALVIAISSRPDLLLLDDPTAGLDPLVRREVLEGILEATADEGGAVLYASHLIHDVERTADRIVALDHARKVLDARVDDVRARVRRATAVFEAAAPPVDPAIPGCLHAAVDGRILTVTSDAPEDDVRRTLAGLGAHAIEFDPVSLEDVLVAMLRHGATGPADDTEETR